MTYFQALILGLVQGLTEFLPVSSSGHLIMIPWFLKWKPAGLGFDVALHWGTLLGVVMYFWRDLKNLTMGFFGSLQGKREFNNTLPWMLILGTIPAALMGLLFEDFVEETLRSPWVVASTLALVGLFIYYADNRKSGACIFENMNWIHALIIGVFQGLALVPGVSRSGITIGMGLMLSYKREAAVRFSFLLSIPIILGAGILKIHYLINNILNPIFLTGLAASAISGFLAISFLLRYVKKNTFTPFVVYRILLAMVIAGMIITRQ